jgi:predicted phosphodiesterase
MDLGHFDQALLLFGGPYSNLQAVLALKQKAESLCIPPHRIICTGDIVAYCGQPHETVEAIREWGIHVLMGNCEESFASDANDCGCGFEEGSSCDLLSVEWFQFANKQLTQQQRDWFLSLPRTMTFSILDKQCQVVHGSAASINQFLFSSQNDSLFEEQFNITNTDIIIAGHSGIPFTKSIGSRLWHNAGAIGMPANDGTTNTWYSMLSPDNQELKIEILALEYDFKKASAKMIQAGLNNGYSKALHTGLWPSQDVLPEHEKRQQGINIEGSTFFYPA